MFEEVFRFDDEPVGNKFIKLDSISLDDAVNESFNGRRSFTVHDDNYDPLCSMDLEVIPGFQVCCNTYHQHMMLSNLIVHGPISPIIEKLSEILRQYSFCLIFKSNTLEHMITAKSLNMEQLFFSRFRLCMLNVLMYKEL